MRPAVLGATAALLVTVGTVASCLTPTDEHLSLDRKVGKAELDGMRLEEVDGLAAIRELATGRARIRAASPVLHLEATLPPSGAELLEITVENAMPGAEMTVRCPAASACEAVPLPTDRPTLARWDVVLAPGQTAELRVAPPDWDQPTPYRFAALSDVQQAIGEVDEIFARMNEDDTIRFVISTGDLTHRGRRSELVHLQEQLEVLEVPFFSTYGNHEAVGDPIDWHELFGPFNSHFVFKGVFFSLIDSSAASIDPEVYDRMRPWLEASRGDLHLFATHVPPFEPIGTRSVAFRSRTEAAKLVAMLADADVDIAVYGHLHTFDSYSTGGIPAYISGGGGATENRLDGIGRHYMTVDVTPGERFDRAALVRIDDD